VRGNIIMMYDTVCVCARVCVCRYIKYFSLYIIIFIVFNYYESIFYLFNKYNKHKNIDEQKLDSHLKLAWHVFKLNQLGFLSLKKNLLCQLWLKIYLDK